MMATAWRGVAGLVLLLGCAPVPEDVQRGRQQIIAQDCGACHVISGIRGARGRVGPSLEHYSRQVYIAGRLPNNPAALARWLQDPPAVKPDTAMPNLGLDRAAAADIAAYLLRSP